MKTQINQLEEQDFANRPFIKSRVLCRVKCRQMPKCPLFLSIRARTCVIFVLGILLGNWHFIVQKTRH